MVAPACSSSLLAVLRCSSLPAPAPIAAPTAVAASSGGGNRPTRDPARAQAGCTLADNVVGLFHGQVALEVLADDHRAVQVAAAGQDRLVVVVGGVLRHVAADQHIDRLVIECHLAS